MKSLYDVINANIYKVLRVFIFKKSLYNSFIINAINYIFFNIHNQVIIKLLTFHSITNTLLK